MNDKILYHVTYRDPASGIDGGVSVTKPGLAMMHARVLMRLGASTVNIRMEPYEELGRFGHHPIPAYDFEIEVGDILAEIENQKAGLEPEYDIDERIAKALEFVVGGDPISISAKGLLRTAMDLRRQEAAS